MNDSSPAVLDDRLRRLRKALPFSSRVVGGLQHGVVSAAAAFLAYAPVAMLGFKEAFWGAVTAIAVVQTELHATQTTARDQCVGAAIGGVTGLGMMLLFGSGLAVYVAAVVLGMSICSILNVASASRLTGSTVTIILLVPHAGPPQRIMFARAR